MMYWIKERHNPQTGVYYVMMGQMTAKEARGYEKHRSYGTNYMHKFRSHAEYSAEAERLSQAGERVQGRI